MVAASIIRSPSGCPDREVWLSTMEAVEDAGPNPAALIGLVQEVAIRQSLFFFDRRELTHSSLVVRVQERFSC